MNEVEPTESANRPEPEVAFTVHSLATKVQVAPATVYRWIDDGIIQAEINSKKRLSIPYKKAKAVFFGTLWWPDPDLPPEQQFTWTLSESARFLGYTQNFLTVRVLNGEIASRRIGCRFLLCPKDLKELKARMHAEWLSAIPCRASQAEKLMTIRQAATAIGCVPSLIHYWVANGLLPALRADDGPRLRVSARRVTEIIELMEGIKSHPERGEVTAQIRSGLGLQPVRRGRVKKPSHQAATTAESFLPLGAQAKVLGPPRTSAALSHS
jgi:hypothetical protein